MMMRWVSTCFTPWARSRAPSGSGACTLSASGSMSSGSHRCCQMSQPPRWCSAVLPCSAGRRRSAVASAPWWFVLHWQRAVSPLPRASQVSASGHVRHSGALGVHCMAPKSIIAWFSRPASWPRPRGRQKLKLLLSLRRVDGRGDAIESRQHAYTLPSTAAASMPKASERWPLPYSRPRPSAF
jgi:hypothetical protein